MRLGLLGFPIHHSKSPELYKKLLNQQLSSYELFSFNNPTEIPQISFFQERLDGLNITSPYKRHFFDQVIIESEIVNKIGAINTISFSSRGVFGTNTDFLAIVKILSNFKSQFDSLKIILLGDGVMANLTKIVLQDLQIQFLQLSRRNHDNFSFLDITKYFEVNLQILIINSCSRDYIFRGNLSGEEIFWDYNYLFPPHQDTIPSRVKLYKDGQDLLSIQALEAIKFWNEH